MNPKFATGHAEKSSELQIRDTRSAYEPCKRVAGQGRWTPIKLGDEIDFIALDTLAIADAVSSLDKRFIETVRDRSHGYARSIVGTAADLIDPISPQ